MTLSVGNLTFETADRSLAVDGVICAFSKRELALLELFLRRSANVINKDAIESALYGFDDAATPNAIEVLTHRVRKKLVDYGATVEIHNLRGIGYILKERTV